MPTLDRITIYPVKSLDGVEVAEAAVLSSGALENDRRWQLTDMDGRVLNAKRTSRVHAIRAEFDLAARSITLRRWSDPPDAAAPTFPLVPGPDGPCGWLAEALGERVLLVERREGGFPDDREAPGPTVAATASLEEVGRWFGLGLDEVRRRFRVNLEIGGCDAFWEDALASPARPGLEPSFLDLPAGLATDPYADLPPPDSREFTVGDVRLRAVTVCRRCVVPSRDSRTGAVTEHFRDIFEARRRRTLPADVDASAWDTLYRLAVNTTASNGGRIALGDAVVARGE